jgi:hypothetical protein
LQTRHSAAHPNIKHIGPCTLWRSRKRVQPAVSREEQEGPRPIQRYHGPSSRQRRL